MSEMTEIVTEEFDRLCNAKFSEVRGCILRDGAWTEETLDDWFHQLEENRSAIESEINHIHLEQLFWLGDDDDLKPDEVIDVGRKIKEVWEASLNKSFPRTPTVVRFDETTPPDGWLRDLQVTVYVQRNA